VIPLRLPSFYSIRSGPKIVHKETLYEIARQFRPQKGGTRFKEGLIRRTQWEEPWYGHNEITPPCWNS